MKPSWKFECGPVIKRGEGLLPRSLFTLRNVGVLTVSIKGTTLTVDPVGRKILLNGIPSVLIPEGSKCSLLWFRRMGIEIGHRGRNTEGPKCMWYGAGLEIDNKKHGHKVHSDGSISPIEN